MEMWERLVEEFPDMRFHTHLAENLEVCVGVPRRFISYSFAHTNRPLLQVAVASVHDFKKMALDRYGPGSREYHQIDAYVTQTEIWNHYGLLTPRTSFAHTIRKALCMIC